MSNKALKTEVKRFIVKSLAIYETPSEVAASVKEIFAVEISRQTVQNYDPTSAAGKSLSNNLRELFEQTRTGFEENEIIPLSKKNVRIKKLSKYVEKFENMGNYAKAAEIIEQIAKEQGGAFTNRREISGRGGKPIEFHPMTLAE